jgi:glycogen(starch) synthase
MRSEQPRRVLFITLAYLPWLGGLEVLADQLLQELRSRGHEVGVLTCTYAAVPSGLAEVNGIPVFRTAVQEALARDDRAAVLRCTAEIHEFVRSFEPDVVHAHDPSTALWMYLRTQRRKRPLISTLHSVTSAHRGDQLAEVSALVRESDRMTGVSHAVVNDLVELFPEVAGRVSVVRNAVKAPANPPEAVAEDAPLLCIGRLVALKGFDMAIEAFALVAHRYPGARLVVAGTGPCREDLAALAERLGVGRRVEFIGRVEPGDDVFDVLASSRALVMASRYEGLPLVSLEAAWAARPVVAMTNPGVAEVVVDGTTGLLVGSGDIVGLARSMEAVLDSTELATSLGAAARARMQANWSIDATVDAYESVYRAALNDHQHRSIGRSI